MDRRGKSSSLFWCQAGAAARLSCRWEEQACPSGGDPPFSRTVQGNALVRCCPPLQPGCRCMRQGRRTGKDLPARPGKGRVKKSFRGEKCGPQDTAGRACPVRCSLVMAPGLRLLPLRSLRPHRPARGATDNMACPLPRYCVLVWQPLPRPHVPGTKTVRQPPVPCRIARHRGGTRVFYRLTDLSEHLSGLAPGRALVRAVPGGLRDSPAAGPRGHGGRLS